MTRVRSGLDWMCVAVLVASLPACQLPREMGLSGTDAAAGSASPQPQASATLQAPIQLPDLPLACDEAECRTLLRTDDWPHDVLTEWWYYTGHLRDGDGQRFGFEFVIFQSIRGANPVGYLSHFAITDEASGRFAYDARSSQRPRIASTGTLEVDGWTLDGAGREDHLAASMEAYGLELALSSHKPPALHHGGLISFGPAGDSYYFSRTRMAATGRLRRGDSWTDVTGEAWHDHQWGDFIVSAVGGWDWISVQLDGNRELMLTVLRHPDGSRAGAFGSFVESDGRTVEVPAETITIDSTGSWSSPRTGIVYPSGWRATVSESEAVPAIGLVLAPLLADQELAFERMSYWEGAADVTGTVDGRAVSGQGYVELTGYGS